MEWLEKLLNEATDAEGKVDTAALMAAVKKEFPNHAVPKSDFNTISAAKKKLEDDIKARDKQLEDLKKENGDAEKLQEQIKALQEQNKETQKKYDADMKELKLTNAIKVALAGSDPIKDHILDITKQISAVAKNISASTFIDVCRYHIGIYLPSLGLSNTKDGIFASTFISIHQPSRVHGINQFETGHRRYSIEPYFSRNW